MDYAQLMEQAGNESDLQAELGSSVAYKDRALAIYNELEQLNQQYGQAAILPNRVVDRIHTLHTHLNHTMNEWEQHKARARSETRTYDSAMEQQRGLGPIGQQLHAVTGGAPGQFNEPIEARLQKRAQGIKSNAPVPQRSPSGMPGNAQAPAPAYQAQPQQSMPSRKPVQPGQPQFGHSGAYAKRFGLQ